jgi:hypothetical protein
VGPGSSPDRAVDEPASAGRFRLPPGLSEYYGLSGGEAPSVQRRGEGALPSEEVHAQAAQGTAGAGGPLPHLAQIQRSFGRHDLSHVTAHVDGSASAASRAMGAEAFTRGDHIAFSSAPSLHTAAHEAAHVVQQAGGVQLKGGVGESGDPHERHADAVADKVVAGESAEPLLDAYGVGARSTSVQQSRVQLMSTSWGSPITYSWELEGKDPKILHYYYDPSLLTDSDWMRLRYTRKPSSWWGWPIGSMWKLVRSTFPYLQNMFDDDAWEAEGRKAIDTTNPLLDGLRILKWFVIDYYKKRFRGLQKMPQAPGYYRDDLLDEGDGKMIWEVTHRSFEDSISNIFQQVAFNQANLTLEPNYHFHMAFKRPDFKNEAQRNQWGGRMAELAAHLNNYSALRTMEQDQGKHMSGKYLGAFSEEQVDLLGQRLAMPKIPYGADDGLEETDHEGHNIGMFKFGGVAMRQTYNRKFDPSESSPTVKKPDPSMVGFEFRAQHDLAATKANMEAVASVLEHFPVEVGDKHPKGNLGSLRNQPGQSGQQDGQRYSVTNMPRIHPKAAVFDQLAGAGGNGLRVAQLVERALTHMPPGTTLPWVMVGDPTMPHAESAANQKHALKIRWSIAFLPWETHPMVPVACRQAIVTARNGLLATLAALPDDPAAQLYTRIQSELSVWASATQIWKYF